MGLKERGEGKREGRKEDGQIDPCTFAGGARIH